MHSTKKEEETPQNHTNSNRKKRKTCLGEMEWGRDLRLERDLGEMVEFSQHQHERIL
jgi:hypothetical protein